MGPRAIEKIAIVVGHTRRSSGAVNFLGESEYDFNKRMAFLMKERIEKTSEKQCEVFFRDNIGRSGVAKAVGKWGADLSLELHFNSFKKKAYGCEVLVYKDAKMFDDSAIFADELTDELAKVFALRQRHSVTTEDGVYREGVKALGSKDRGAFNLKAMEQNKVPYALLIEPCFANFETHESVAIFRNEEKYAFTVADYLADL